MRIPHALLIVLALRPMETCWAQCHQRVEMSSYSVCLPKTWHVLRKDAATDSVLACNLSSERCIGKGAGGFPLPGAVWIRLMPAKEPSGGAPFKSAMDIVSSTPHAGRPAPPVTEVDLNGIGTRCLLARSLWSPPDVWNETYGLEAGDRLFEAWVQYENEPPRIEAYRTVVKDILSSVTVRGAAHRNR
jgi:hypothetical protein